MRRTLLLLSVSALVLASCSSDTDGGKDARSPAGASEVPATGSATTTVSPSTALMSITLLSGEAPLPTYTIENGKYAGETGEALALGDPCDDYFLVPDTRWVALRECTGWAALETPFWSHASAPEFLPNHSGAEPTHTDYDVTFTLPEAFTSPSISVLVLADNAAEVLLNGASIGVQVLSRKNDWREDWRAGDWEEVGDNWAFGSFPWQFDSEDPSLFRPGVNTLRFHVIDLGGPTGVDYSATVTYVATE